MKVMIVGGGGLLGQKMIEVLKRETDWKLSSVIRAGIADIEGSVEFDTLQRKDWKEIALAERWKPDVIINCAAMTNVDMCELRKEDAWRTNVNLVEILCEVSRKVDSRLIQLSTDYVFDGTAGPYSETDVPNPINYYGKTKLAAENVCTRSGVETAIVRTMWLYGDAEGGKSTFPAWVVKSLAAKESIRVVTDEIGTPTLTDDLAYGIVKLIESKRTGTFNLAGPVTMSRWDHARIIASTIGADPELVSAATTADLNRTARRPLQSGLDTLKAKTQLAFSAQEPAEGLRICRTSQERRILNMPS